MRPMSQRIRPGGVRRALRALALAFALAAAGGSEECAAAQQIGPVTGLPLPRFVSLKSDRVNLHEGPSKDHRTIWIFERAGLPVEITAAFDIWRRIRDSEGAEGWVLHSLLSGRRTALVAPWRKAEEFNLRSTPSAEAPVRAKLQSGVIGALKSCNGSWCRIAGEGFDGWIEQQNLWGAYPDEKIE